MITKSKTELLAKIDSAEAELSEAQATWERMKSHGSPLPSMPTFEQHTRANQRVSKAESELDRLRDELALVEAQDTFERSGSEAASRAKAGRARLDAADKKLSDLDARLARLKTKQAEVQEQSSRSLQKARDEYSAAENALAVAFTDGDASSQKAAEDKLRRAASAIELAADESPVLRAIAKELSRLEADRDELVEEAAAARSEVSDALCCRYRVEWERAAEALADIGAKLHAAGKLSGHSQFELRNLNVHRFTPGSPTLTQRQIEERAVGVQLPEVRSGLLSSLFS